MFCKNSDFKFNIAFNYCAKYIIMDKLMLTDPTNQT